MSRRVSITTLVFLENNSKLVDSLSKRLGLLPPHRGRIDKAKSCVACYYLMTVLHIYSHYSAHDRGATISHARTGL